MVTPMGTRLGGFELRDLGLVFNSDINLPYHHLAKSDLASSSRIFSMTAL
ncbi:hypothetical protein [Moraxella lacunata]